MIADKIKELREANSMTQNEVAKRLGITRSSVNAWEIHWDFCEEQDGSVSDHGSAESTGAER